VLHQELGLLHESTTTNGVLMRKTEPSPEEALRLQARKQHAYPRVLASWSIHVIPCADLPRQTWPVHLGINLLGAGTEGGEAQGEPRAVAPPNEPPSLRPGSCTAVSLEIVDVACSRDGAAVKFRINKCAAENDPKTALEM
jgi:hypothetical protein